MFWTLALMPFVIVPNTPPIVVRRVLPQYRTHIVMEAELMTWDLMRSCQDLIFVKIFVLITDWSRLKTRSLKNAKCSLTRFLPTNANFTLCQTRSRSISILSSDFIFSFSYFNFLSSLRSNFSLVFLILFLLTTLLDASLPLTSVMLAGLDCPLPITDLRVKI